MIKSVKLMFSETGLLDLDLNGITIFVGPNNSGKSLILREIETAASSETHPNHLEIVQDIDIEWPDLKKIEEEIEKAKKLNHPGVPDNQVQLGRINPNSGRETVQVNITNLIDAVKNRHRKLWFCSRYLRWGLIRLDGRSRFDLTIDQTAGDLEEPPNNILAKLFMDESAREKVRALVKDAFGKFFYIDPTNLGKFRIKLSEGKIPGDEQSLNSDAREFYRTSTHIKNQAMEYKRLLE